MAEEECRETLQGLLHILLPAILSLLWIQMVVSVPQMIKRCSHQPSERKTSRIRLRYRPSHLRYHRYKRRRKWKRKRSFRKLGVRFNMRGDDRLYIHKQRSAFMYFTSM